MRFQGQGIYWLTGTHSKQYGTIINAINYTCVYPAKTGQNGCCEWGQFTEEFPAMNKSLLAAELINYTVYIFFPLFIFKIFPKVIAEALLNLPESPDSNWSSVAWR